MPFQKGQSGNRATQFKQGKSGNPRGRPPGRSVSAIMKKMLNAKSGKIAKELAQMAIDKALEGDIRYFKEILDRVGDHIIDDSDSNDQLSTTIILQDMDGLEVELPDTDDENEA